MASTVAAWPTVALGEVLRKSEAWVDIKPDTEYAQVTVRLWGKGVALRGRVLGNQIAASRQLVARTNQFILSRIDARNGAFGLVTSELDGAVVSNDFPVFNLDESRVVPAYLDWMSKTRDFVEMCQRASEGTTNRVRLKEERFIAATIPLPPLDEQRRIVARIEALAGRIAEARGLRQAAMDELGDLVAAEEMRLWPNECLRGAETLADVTVFLSRGRQSAQGDSDHLLIKTQHVQQGYYVRSRLTLAPDAARKVTGEALVQPNDILIACSAAGCLGRVAQLNDSPVTASTDTHVAIARANVSKVLPTYLYFYLRGAQGQFQLRSRERGDWTKEKVGFRLLELNLADLRRVPVPLPNIAEQRRIVTYVNELYEQIGAASLFQAESSTYIGALLPSLLDKAFRGEL